MRKKYMYFPMQELEFKSFWFKVMNDPKTNLEYF